MFFLNKKIKTISILFSTLLTAGSQTAWSVAKTESCEIEFAFDSADLNEAALETCLTQINPNEIEFFHIFATASYPGTLAYNRSLSERRADSVEGFLKRRFPKTTIERIGGGEHPEGQKAKVFAVMSTVDREAVDTAVSTAIDNYAQKIENERKTRVVVRGSYDNYRIADEYNYRSIGLEITRLSSVYRDTFYGEAGLNIIRHNHDDRMDLYSANALLGGYAKAGLATAGIRGFVGNLALENNSDNTINTGGELRLGIEGKRVSAFAVGGLSKEFRTIGLDFGVRL